MCGMRKVKREYLIQVIDARGRRLVAVNGKDEPADKWDRSTGWCFHEEDLPVHGGGSGRKGNR